MTTTTNKVLPVALVAALLGGTVGAFVMRDGKRTPEVAVASEQAKTTDVADANKSDDPNALLNQEIADETKNMTDEERTAFRAGFDEGVQAARDNELTGTARNTTTTRNVVYRPVTRTRTVRRSAPRRVYYDYGQTKGRSFWQKHRDKLTVAMGTGGGALLGGLIGGKRGAGIGALAGAGGSALYTYKIRKRNRNY
ncbi:MAG TPA: hypothetical protein VGP08_04445 [Pyrinomonadaceae bacterium]|jgi:hypothetical protein|nr:hypothetical protein [Pyrinomonadaceae bacterium]